MATLRCPPYFGLFPPPADEAGDDDEPQAARAGTERIVAPEASRKFRRVSEPRS
jgi:hypothetical protein